MDPTNRGSEEFHDDERTPDEPGATGRPPRESAAAPEVPAAQGPVRVVQLVAGDYLLTVNPVDGSEIEPCPPGALPARPERHGPERREGLRLAAAPPPPARQAGPQLPLVGRSEERERLGRLLSRGRSVRLTGPSGSGRSVLLDAVAEDCAGLAPDGVVRLSGYHRTPTDLLHELFAVVHHAPLHRLERGELLAAVHEIGAVVVLDDLEFGGAALDELLDATPECAFLLAATPDVAAPSTDSHVEEVFLGGLDRTGCLELLELAVDRPLTDEEADWAADLWFESEGLPLRFVQAGALLRQKDELASAPAAADDGFGVFAERPYAAAGDGEDEGRPASLPSLAEAAGPAVLLASRLDEAARNALRFAVALGGEMPHQAHLPALAGDTHADAAVGDLLACGLITPVGAHYRLAAGVAEQLLAGATATRPPPGRTPPPSTTPGGPGTPPSPPSGSPRRARSSSPRWAPSSATATPGTGRPRCCSPVPPHRPSRPRCTGAWERALRAGQEAARLAGEVGEEAYFHHELGVLALCTGNLDRARAQLEASIGLRGVLADKRGAVAGRRALALVADRSGLAMGARTVPGGGPARTGSTRVPPLPPLRTPSGEEVPAARREESAAPPAKPATARPVRPQPADSTTTIVSRVPAAAGAPAAAAAPVPVPPAPRGAARWAGRRGRTSSWPAATGATSSRRARAPSSPPSSAPSSPSAPPRAAGTETARRRSGPASRRTGRTATAG
ncbi:ATP-binding protein [Streptomyces griseocarneus]|uniref:ATP-binding protein n=1 Tax=Streptomyces griseocarneus TaxID=51201 RepID=A0ABX7RSQ8_9ACTN|nr:ATP-binding protein [Streptomyces griseocarneus]QSY51042.1 ATP-binding protein [Streptomyces griseocarneus]